MNSKPSHEEIAAYLAEDMGSGDLTALIIPVLCGQAWLDAVFWYLNQDIGIEWFCKEGDAIGANTVLCQLHGPARALLTGERTALNLLQTLSSTATTARRYTEAINGTDCKILDTRKTIPGLRMAQKYAVKCGGCVNHRLGLFDAILIKENHIIASGSIHAAILKARQISDALVEIEVESLAELQEALAAKPDRIMLDNFSLDDLKSAVELTRGTTELEASGNISLENVRSVAETGVDYISIGALTKNIDAIDLSMRIKLLSA